ncbi:MAG TPA: carbon-nitrogen hydrolase family protein, partial [Solirubrobacterales bacterium]|nr:carbon-nitrogen hydrolase family protein [Solirubrobacterales bacterium]
MSEATTNAVAAPRASQRSGGAGRLPQVDEFSVVERTYSDDPDGMSVGIANIEAVVPDIEANKDKVLRAAQVFRERGANVAVFPEFCLSGYFWDEPAACRRYMDAAVSERHRDWINQELRPILGDELRLLVLNNLSEGADGLYRNRTFLVSVDDEEGYDFLAPERTYDKIFLPGIERDFTSSGLDDRLVLDSRVGHGRFGFTTCYDYLFQELLRSYTLKDGVDAIVQIASWRAVATRDYPRMNVRTDTYYGKLWDSVMSDSSATNQVWTIACNAVGRHPVSGAAFWGGSGIWAPSGIPLIQASHIQEQLLLVHNLDISGSRQSELDDFDYAFDFRDVYNQIEGSKAQIT